MLWENANHGKRSSSGISSRWSHCWRRKIVVDQLLPSFAKFGFGIVVDLCCGSATIIRQICGSATTIIRQIVVDQLLPSFAKFARLRMNFCITSIEVERSLSKYNQVLTDLRQKVCLWKTSVQSCFSISTIHYSRYVKMYMILVTEKSK